MVKSNIIVKTISGILKVMPKGFKKRSLGVSLLLLLNSVLELFGLASMIPLFTVVFKENIIHENNILSWLYTTLNFSSDNQFIIALTGVIVFTIIAKNFVSLLIFRYQAKFSYDLMEYFLLQLHKFYYSKGFLFFKENNSNVLFRDIFTIPQRFATGIVFGTMTLLNEIAVMTVIVIAIAMYDFSAFLLLAATVAPVFVIFYSLTKDRIKKIGHEINDVTPAITTNIYQSLFGYVDVIISGTYNFFRQRLTENIAIYKKPSIDKVMLNFAPTKVIESSMVFAIFVIMVYGIFFLPSKESLLALLGVFALSGYRIMPSINRIMQSLNGLIEMQYTFDVIGQLDNFKESKNVMEKESFEFKEKITIENLAFRYPSATNDVLKEYNLTIKKGEIIGIMGKSGGGKTTLMNILLGFLHPTGGNIKIDNIVLNSKNMACWQHKIGYVQQEVYLLDASLSENIAFGLHEDKIDYDKLKKVISLASLQELVAKMPEGLNTMVGERGAQLSGGQRQRVGIARALYFDSEVLFFDEATSALDAQTEKEITESINNLSGKGLTMIIIAHRESSLKGADRIINI